jgi:hypothetical protein
MGRKPKLAMVCVVLVAGIAAAWLFRKPEGLADPTPASLPDSGVVLRESRPFEVRPFPVDPNLADDTLYKKPVVDVAPTEPPPLPKVSLVWPTVEPEPTLAPPPPPMVAIEATQPAVEPSAALTREIHHRVQEGETLSGLARRYLGSGTRYRELYEANRDVLASPDALRVGMELRIPVVKGSMRPVSSPSVTPPESPQLVPINTAGWRLSREPTPPPPPQE